MSWLFSQVLVEEYSQGISSDGEPSALSNMSHIPQAYSSPDKMTVFCRLSRFGMTFAPLTETRGEALLMSFLADFHVKTSVQPEKVPELGGGAAASGKKWHELLAKFDPVTSSWRTAQCSLLEELEQSLVTWPRSGSMLNGACYQQPMLVLRILENESGYWPTPTVCGNYNRKGLSKNSGDGLATAVNRMTYPTPSASDGTRGGVMTENMTGQSLTQVINTMARFPTPCATDHKGSGKSGTLRDRLDYAAERGATKSNTYATPTAACAHGGHQRGKNKQGGDDLRQQIGGQLNPTWVEWLMGWPLGWTDLKPLVTDKFREWQQQHGSCLID